MTRDSIREGLVELAEACEKADAGSFDLNKAILSALGYTWRGMAYWFHDDSHAWKGSTNFTASIDAAMSLVPEGMKFILDTHHMIVTIYEYWPISSPEDEGFASYQAEAATPALALVAAALRAKAQS